MLTWSHQATLGWLPSLGHPAAGERGAGGVLRYVFILGTVSLRCKLFLSMPFSFACFPCTRSLKDGAGIARWLGWAAVLLGGVEVGRIWSYIWTPKRRWPVCQVCLQRAPHKMVGKVLRATGTKCLLLGIFEIRTWMRPVRKKTLSCKCQGCLNLFFFLVSQETPTPLHQGLKGLY